MLGIIVGITAVIVVMSVGAGAQSLILNQVKGMGSNLIGILPGKSDEKGPPASVMGIITTTLKYDEIRGLVSPENPHIIAQTPYVRGIDTITYNGNKVDTNFVGVSASLPEVEDTNVMKGRFFTDDEEKSMSKIAILGYTVANDLFGDTDPIGKQIKIKKVQFNIIGVMKKRGTSGFQNQDDQIYVPFSTAQKLLLGIDYVSYARIKIDDATNVNSSLEYVKSYLREKHNIDNPEKDDFSARTMAEGLDAITNITNALKLFLVAIASIALLVGGIGIMNIMLAAVQERTREIGLRKAIGAKSHHIVQQFLIETVFITLIGGIIGIILGMLISIIVAKIAQNMGYSWDLVISPISIILACIVSISIGLIFGISPAKRASKLDPIKALHYE